MSNIMEHLTQTRESFINDFTINANNSRMRRDWAVQELQQILMLRLRILARKMHDNKDYTMLMDFCSTIEEGQ